MSVVGQSDIGPFGMSASTPVATGRDTERPPVLRIPAFSQFLIGLPFMLLRAQRENCQK